MSKVNSQDGPLVTQAYVCNGPGQDLHLQDITLPPLEATMVEIEMMCCGLCHTVSSKTQQTACIRFTVHYAYTFLRIILFLLLDRRPFRTYG